MPPAITPQRAQQLFELVDARLCCPASAPSPCIPFLYPDNGCWARAHEMCRLMIADGAQPEKVWIHGALEVKSANKPSCLVQWSWHVAPTLQVDTGGTTETWVIDPSLFPGPVTQDTWKSVQGDPAAVLEPSDASIFYQGIGGGGAQTDPSYTQSDQVLDNHRNLLKLRSASSDGPPPYFACMTPGPSVQWFGSLAPNQTHRWFTWGWSASSHVIWTVMPLTPCPGGPQLTWKVAVERASADHCTYWITVTNLTSDPVKFEGRYDVLEW